MVTRGKGVYSRRKESIWGGLQALTPPSGQHNYFTSRAFDSFFPVLQSQFCQLLLFLKYNCFSNSGLSNTVKIILLYNHFEKVKKRPQILVNSLSRIKDYYPGLSQPDEIQTK